METNANCLEKPDNVLMRITEISQEQHYKANHVLFNEGDAADPQ